MFWKCLDCDKHLYSWMEVKAHVAMGHRVKDILNDY